MSILARAGCAALTAALAAAVTGCAAGGPPAVAGTAAPSHSLRVGLLEWRIVTSAPAVIPGVDRLTVTNTGTTSHDLQVTGPGVRAHTPLLAPGATASLTLRIRAGTTLRLTCEVPGHEEAGMHTTLQVIQ